MKLSMSNISAGYGTQTVLKDISFDFQQGEVVCILGPNGVGKTTLFRSIMGFLSVYQGEIFLDGIAKDKISNYDFAKAVSYVPQNQETSFPFSVIDMVVMGCTVHLKPFEMPGIREYSIATRIINLLGIAHLKDKLFSQISGGERQMVLIARALAQHPKLLVMDEPTANLDFGNQLKVLECIRELVHFQLGVLMTTHNPDHAFLCCDRAILLTKEGIPIIGLVDEVVTEENLEKAYGVKVKIIESKLPDGVVKSCVPLLQ